MLRYRPCRPKHYSLSGVSQHTTAATVISERRRLCRRTSHCRPVVDSTTDLAMCSRERLFALLLLPPERRRPASNVRDPLQIQCPGFFPSSRVYYKGVTKRYLLPAHVHLACADVLMESSKVALKGAEVNISGWRLTNYQQHHPFVTSVSSAVPTT